MDRAGVRWAGNGPVGRDELWLPFVRLAPDRFLPFAGQGAIGELIRTRGDAAWTLRSPDMLGYLEGLEQELRAGRFRGIGELFVNNLSSHPPTLQPTRYPADSPLMGRLLALAATYQAPLSIHMDADPAAVEELERLLALDRKGSVIWAHCGFWADPSLVQKLMTQHPNLFCELSYRDDRLDRPFIRRWARNLPITEFERRVKPDWKVLLEEYSDRFLIGTDTDNPGEYQSVIDFFRAVLAQLTPEAAGRIAYENAQRIFRLDAP